MRRLNTTITEDLKKTSAFPKTNAFSIIHKISHYEKNKALFISLFFSVILLFGCEKNTTPEVGQSLVDLEDCYDSEATAYYQNLNCILKLICDHPLATRSDVDEETDSLSSQILERLSSIMIWDDVNQREMSFHELSPDQKESFIDEYTAFFTKALSSKLRKAPELVDYIREQNQIVNGLLDEGLRKDIKTRSSNVGDEIVSRLMRSLNDKVDQFKKDYHGEDSHGIETRGISSSVTWVDQTVEYDRVNSIIAGKAKRGDIFVVLPCHYFPWSQIDLGNESYKVGHTEIVVQDITETTSINDDTTIGAWVEDGIQYNTLRNWCYQSYLLGLCHYKYVWRWNWLKSGFYLEQYPISNPSRLADEAINHLNKDYVRWYEFLTAKWAAPERFTCATLVWWCAKQIDNDISLSPWYSTLVYPSDIYLSENTFIKAVIE